RGRGVAVARPLWIAAGECVGQIYFRLSGPVIYKPATRVTAGLVIFEPANQKISARGEIKPDGSFQLGTHGDNDGAMEGEYKVLVAPPPLPEEGKRRRHTVHPKYQNLDATPLKFTVTRDREKNKLKIQVE